MPDNDGRVVALNNSKEAERVKKRIMGPAQAPSTRQQAASRFYIDQTIDFLGQPFDATKIPLSKLYQMRKDSMIAFALHHVKVPLMRAPWYIESEDAQIAAFIDNALRRIYPRLIQQYCLTFDFGFQGIAKRFEKDLPDWTYIDPQDPFQEKKKVWDEGDIAAIVWKDFVPLRPELTNPRWTDDGRFDGIHYSKTNTNAKRRLFPFQPGSDESSDDIDVTHSLWVTNEKDVELGSIWGYPRIGYAYRYWWSYWYNWALADRHFEKDADPATIVYYPEEEESVDADGNPVDMRQIAIGVGQDVRSGSTVALPGSVVASEFDGRPTGIREWEIDFMSGGGNFDAFDARFHYLDVMKMRSIFVPEQAFMEGRGGTSSRNVAREEIDVNKEAQSLSMDDFDNHINSFVIPDLVKANFPEKVGIRATKKTKGFGSEDVEFIKQILQLIGQSDHNELEVDVRAALKEAGVPLLSPEQAQRKRDEIARQAAALGPPAVADTSPNADVTDTGFYIQMPERIKLGSEKHDIINVELVDEVPSDEEGVLAAFDEDSGTVYFHKSVSVQDRMAYVEVLKETLSVNGD